jgi:hypothetical protein
VTRSPSSFLRYNGLLEPCAKPHYCVVLDTPTTTLILTGAIGCVTVYIAWQQWQTAKNKLRFELFERRFAAFDAAMKLVSIAVKKGDVPDEARQEFLVATKGVQFLCDQKLQDYCDTLAKEALSVRVGKQLLDSDSLPVGTRRTQSAVALGDRIKWFSDQVDEIPRRFASFLKIRG